jgi:hypothetical protein
VTETVLVKASFAFFQNAISKESFPLLYGIFQHALHFNTDTDKRVDNFPLHCISDDSAFFVSIASDGGAIAVFVLFSTQAVFHITSICLHIFFISSLTLFNTHISSIS